MARKAGGQPVPDAVVKTVSCRRILFACYDFNIGGHSSHCLNFGRALRRRGHTVAALVPEPFGELYSEFRESFDRIEVVRRSVETRSAYLRRLVGTVVSMRPDVLINNVVPGVQAALPGLPEEMVRICVVHSIHERERRILTRHVDFVDWIVAISDNVRANLIGRFPDDDRVVVIPAGLELPSTGRRPRGVRMPLRMIYVGRIEPEKNLSGLLRILSTLKEASLPFLMTVVGNGKELKSVMSQVKASPFAKQVRFLGARTQREVACLLDEHDFLLLTSHYEGTPHAVLEAMAHGVVVLASRLAGSTDRMITHAIDGFLCDRERPEEYFRILRRLSNVPTEFDSVSTAAWNTVLSRYSADALSAQYEPLFNRTTRGKAPKCERKAVHVSDTAALPDFPGIVLQCKHRLADLWLALAKGRRPVELRPD